MIEYLEQPNIKVLLTWGSLIFTEAFEITKYIVKILEPMNVLIVFNKTNDTQ